MARIRIVDDWLRCPNSPPSHYRAVMVVAERWAEQKVLMRAYAESPDQTRPTIVLHGELLAIGPAGTDPNGPWGIHVQPPADGHAQALASQLELAARRLAGARGNAPRLADEVPPFETKRTNNWAPGTPRDVPGQPAGSYYEPAHASAQPPVPSAAPVGRAASPAPNPPRRGWTSPVTAVAPVIDVATGHAAAADGAARSEPPVTPARTALGYASGSGAQSALIRLGLRPSVSARLARLVDLTVPADFEISKTERDVLNALGESAQLSAGDVARISGAPDPMAWMQQLMDRLGRYGLDIVAPGPGAAGEPTYVMRR